MSTPHRQRADLLVKLMEAMRALSDRDVLYSQALADRLGVSLTDFKASSLLAGNGPMPAGRLAELTGLTTGAITGVIDRLEKAGYVRRERDDSDRRKVFIAVVPETATRIGQLYVPMQQSMQKVWSRYSEQELRLLLRFANDGYKGVLEATEALKGLLDAPAQKAATKPRRAR